MSIFNKAANAIKGMFVEEIPEKKVEVKKEVYKVEIAAPEEELSRQEKKEKEVKIEEPKEEILEEPEETPKTEVKTAPKKEENFRFPVYFNEEDIENTREPKREEKVRTSFSRDDFIRSREEKEEKRTSFRDAYGSKKEERPRDFASAYKQEEPKKVFKPTPIISPVYGILDKNYSKEDITTKKPTRLSSELTSDKFTIDDVRKKAYGTLEDDIETSLIGEVKDESAVSSEELFNDIEQENTDNIMADELLNSFESGFDDSFSKNILDDIELPVEETLSRDYDVVEETPKKSTKKATKVVEETDKDDDIDMTESDLFNLIDSWYEKRDEE